MGESATAMGSGRAVRPMPASARRPRPTGRSGSCPTEGTRVVTGEATVTTIMIVQVAQRVLRIGSGRFDGRIGDGDGPRACRGPDAGIEADGKVRPGVPGW
jgi:hypothetical protein